MTRDILPYGMYRSEDMTKSKTLKTFLLHKRVIGKINSNLKYYFFLNENDSFTVKVVYLENSWMNLIVKRLPCTFIFTNEVGLDEFEVSKEKYFEMKRTGNYKSEATFSHSTFYVGKFVELLDEVICKYYNNKMRKITGEEQAQLDMEKALAKKKWVIFILNFRQQQLSIF